MKKIPSLFARDEGGALTTAYNSSALWVADGEGIATLKWDGTAVAVIDGVLYARYDAKRGKAQPPGFIPCQDPDPVTGHYPGWVPATRPEDRWIREATGRWICEATASTAWRDGTYEACGPRIGGNRERFDTHRLIRHGDHVLLDVPRDHAGLIGYFAARDIEGVVWWRVPGYDSCDMVKITGSALGVDRPVIAREEES